MSYIALQKENLYIHGTEEGAKNDGSYAYGKLLISKLTDQKADFLSNAIDQAMRDVENGYKKTTSINMDGVVKEIDNVLNIEELDREIWKSIVKTTGTDRNAEKDSKELYSKMKSDVNFLGEAKENMRSAINTALNSTNEINRLSNKLKRKLTEAEKESVKLNSIFVTFNEIMNSVSGLENGSYITLIKEVFSNNYVESGQRDSIKKSLEDKLKNAKSPDFQLTDLDRGAVEGIENAIKNISHLIYDLSQSGQSSNGKRIEATLRNIFGSAIGEYTDVKNIEIFLEANNMINRNLSGADKVKNGNLNTLGNASGTFKPDAIFKGEGFQFKCNGSSYNLNIEIGFTIKNYLKDYDKKNKIVLDPSKISFKQDSLEFQLRHLLNKYGIQSRYQEIKGIYNYLTHVDNTGNTQALKDLNDFARKATFETLIKSISGTALTNAQGDKTDFAHFMIVNGDVISIYQLIKFIKEGKRYDLIKTEIALGKGSVTKNGTSRTVFGTRDIRKQNIAIKKDKTEAENFSKAQVKAFRNTKVKGELQLLGLKLSNYYLK